MEYNKTNMWKSPITDFYLELSLTWISMFPKTAMRYEKDGDKKNKNILLLSYDLQNEVSSFFYKKS